MITPRVFSLRPFGVTAQFSRANAIPYWFTPSHVPPPASCGYAAVWAECAVLARHHDAARRLAAARQSTVDNPIAMAIVERSAALAVGDRNGILAAAERLQAAGCRYQWARTLILAGGSERSRGEDELAAMGATPMITAASEPA